jgi:hypothetical protein
VVISVLGPQAGNLKDLDHAFFGNFYKDTLFPLMRQHGVRRIFALGTPSYEDPGDRWVWMRPLVHTIFPLFARSAYENILNIARAFKEEGRDIDWTVYRINFISGGSDEQSWRADREQGETFVGYVGHPGWTKSQKRGSLARWLVDAAETGLPDWVGKLPAVSYRAGSG